MRDPETFRDEEVQKVAMTLISALHPGIPTEKDIDKYVEASYRVIEEIDELRT